VVLGAGEAADRSGQHREVHQPSVRAQQVEEPRTTRSSPAVMRSTR